MYKCELSLRHNIIIIIIILEEEERGKILLENCYLSD